jgi:hypothetical protein
MVKIRHKFVRNPEENFAIKVLFFGFFHKITIVERLLTGKLLTGKIPRPEYFPPIRYSKSAWVESEWGRHELFGKKDENTRKLV